MPYLRPAVLQFDGESSYVFHPAQAGIWILQREFRDFMQCTLDTHPICSMLCLRMPLDGLEGFFHINRPSTPDHVVQKRPTGTFSFISRSVTDNNNISACIIPACQY